MIEDGRRGVRVPDVGLIRESDRITDVGVGAPAVVVEENEPSSDVGQVLRDLDTCLSLSNEFILFYHITSAERSLPEPIR